VERQVRRVRLDFGEEVRRARLNAGVRQAAVAQAVGCSPATISRVERGLVELTLERAMRHAAAVGLTVRIATYPVGVPVRDAAQLRLLADLRALLAPAWRWGTEVTMPIPGDLRAFDAEVTIPGCRVSIDAFTRLGDVQAQLRSSLLKKRDAGSDRLVIVVRESAANRRALALADASIRGSFPLGTRAVLRALREGRDPGGDGIVRLDWGRTGQV